MDPFAPLTGRITCLPELPASDVVIVPADESVLEDDWNFIVPWMRSLILRHNEGEIAFLGSGCYPIHDAAGKVVYAEIRTEYTLDGVRDKWVRPFSYKADQRWQLRPPQAPRPLYNLPRIMAGTETVAFVEGPKKAAVFIAYMERHGITGFVVTTTTNGAGSAHLFDLTPLAGRSVVILPDNDNPGLGYAETIKALCPQSRIVDYHLVPWIVDYGMGEGDDIADLIAKGITPERLQDLLSNKYYEKSESQATLVLKRLVDHLIHWEHAQHELAHAYPEMENDTLKVVYKSALLRRYTQADPRVFMVFKSELSVVFTKAGWVDAQTFMETKLDNDLVNHMPAALYLKPPKEKGGGSKVAVDQPIRSNIKNRTPPGMTPIRPYRGICLSRDPNTIPVEAPPKLRFPVRILDDPMPLDEASDQVLRAFPGMQITYLVAAIAAMICGEIGGGQPPALTATGPSGSGKGETVSIAASFLGDSVVKVQLDDNAEAFMRQMGSSTGAGYRALMFDEIGKIRGIQNKMPNILQINARITFRALYHTGLVTIPFRSAMFYPCVRFPDFLRTSPEFLRRTRGVQLHAKVPNWRATSGGDAAEWRHRNATNAFVGNSILTHAYRLCEASNFIFDDVANQLGIGSIGDGAEGIDPENLWNLYAYARSEPAMISGDLSFAKGWIDLNASEARKLITVFADGDDLDPHQWKKSVQTNLEAVSWNDVLGITDPPITIDIKIHGSRWGMRFRKAEQCKRGEEVLNENLPEPR